MNEFEQNLARLISEIPATVRIVAVSKTKPVDLMRSAYKAGQRIFGENRVQEIINKHPEMPADVEWHMIGHLQTNKVRQVLPLVRMIHSIDSLKLLNTVQKEAAKIQKTVSCLFQVHIATEESKHGFSPNELLDILSNIKQGDYPNIIFSGLMGMASFVDDEDQIVAEFKQLKELFNELKSVSMAGNKDFIELSMGMSGDYPLAIEEGSTLIRIGTLLFGSRACSI
ncbi:MAG: YggS family pyridoxal phosphate-dependent enzyme [Bacteroidota bacterium]|nr:YggS family pyridoxal phosphate-dependent enzyme [Bacteroidota bacterium]